MPPGFCPDLLVAFQVSPCMPTRLAEPLSAACEDWMLHFLFPRGQRVLREAFDIEQSFAPSMVCVCSLSFVEQACLGGRTMRLTMVPQAPLNDSYFYRIEAETKQLVTQS